MSEQKEHNDGGPAFPVPVAQPFGDGWMAVGGLSMRDWFAGQALMGMAASQHWEQNFDPSQEGRERWLPEVAKVAYTAADAMIDARKEKQ